MPEGQFKIERKAYIQFLNQCQDGDISYLRLPNKRGLNANVMFFGANYNDDFPVKNLYKALNVIKPDTVLV